MSAVLRKTTAPCVTVHFRNICFGRGSFLHTSQALRPEKRGSPLPMGRTGTDFIPLTLHCVCTRPAGKEVRLRLDFFDARFILSGSVLHFVPDTSYEGEHKRETVTTGVPFSTPHRQSQTRRAESLRCHSAPCRAGPIRSRGFSSSVAAAGFPPTAPSPFGLVSVHGSNPSASTPSPSPFRWPGSHVRSALLAPPPVNHPCQSRKDRHLSPRPSYHPAPAAPVGLPAHSPEDRKNDAGASPFPTSSKSSGGIYARSDVSA